MRKFIFFIFLTAVLAGRNSCAQEVQGEKTCLDCHGKLVKKKVSHLPITKGCNMCHTPNGKQHPLEDVEGFTLPQKVPHLCFSCHKNRYEEANVHKPVSEGDCLSCHDVHSADERHLTSSLPPKQCFFCHTDLKDSVTKASVVHGAMKDSLSCLVCHSPHASPEKKLLVAEEKSLCYSCHNKPIVLDSKTVSNIKAFIEKSKYVHGAIDNNGCSSCHNPHASNNQNLLKDSYPVSNFGPGTKANYGQCFSSCHESTMIEDSLSKETGFRNGARNLHYVHVDKKLGRSCYNCHNVHASNNLYLLLDKVKFGMWEVPLRFKRTEKGGSCAPGCHGVRTYTR